MQPMSICIMVARGKGKSTVTNYGNTWRLLVTLRSYSLVNMLFFPFYLQVRNPARPQFDPQKITCSDLAFNDGAFVNVDEY